MQSMGHAGLALALTIASIFNAVVLTLLLSKRLGDFNLTEISRVITRMIPGLTFMGLTVTLMLGQVDWLIPGRFWPRFALLGSAVLFGGMVYVVSLWLLGVKEIQQAWTILTRRFSSHSPQG